MRHVSWLLLLLGITMGLIGTAQAQNPSRIGIGVQMLGSTAGDNVGPGLRFRASTAVTQDVSLAVGSGITGFIFQGRDNAAFALDPQASVIVSLPATNNRTTYVFGGGGAYVPFGNTSTRSGPTFHLGIGQARLLRESSLFFEFNPGFLVGKETTTLVLPLRVGIIL
ncbi:MAG: hypothetical protein ABEL04_12130 [Salinibacter sp.]|uniref:hypothetical protein n=1 Tax=Salinibacter sp. TaxID=2065818 RepID=UPI0035D4066C